ncbi:MAG: hypothetical protein KC484_08705 [Colwelliaceae bacterium]|nr:hypothetical protein [Colwelliaceae bacterium]
MLKKAVLLSIIFIWGCGGSSTSTAPINTNGGDVTIVQPKIEENLAIPNNTLAQHYKVLLIGNSHVTSNNLPKIIELLIQQGKTNNQVKVEHSSGAGYLDDRINDGVTLEKIESESWTHVVLQAQKYSQSGSRLYSTDAAESWVAIVKQKNATPILFPEHPQKGNSFEGQYVHDIHMSIVENQKSCIAPIGLAWNEAIDELPDLTFHAVDGNHAAYTGSFLTALVFYQVITGELADSLPYMQSIPLSESVQSDLGKIASKILDENQACDY